MISKEKHSNMAARTESVFVFGYEDEEKYE